MARCFGLALWKDNYPGQDFVQATRAFLAIHEAEQPLIADETFTAPGARQALRLEFIYPDKAKDGSVVRLHSFKLNFLRETTQPSPSP